MDPIEKKLDSENPVAEQAEQSEPPVTTEPPAPLEQQQQQDLVTEEVTGGLSLIHI